MNSISNRNLSKASPPVAGRMAFTITELLVALSTVGVLAAILLPGVNAARQASRRVDCGNRLRQIAMACGNFDSRCGAFPGGFGPDRNGHAEGWSPHARLLAELDQATVGNELDFSKSPQAGFLYQGGVEPRIPQFLCPSDGIERGANYVGCGGSTLYPRRTPDKIGVFSRGKGISVGEIKDGTSHTALFSEQRGSRYAGSEYFDPAIDVWYSGAVELGPITDSQFVRVCNSLSAEPRTYFNSVGSLWRYGGFGSTLYDHLQGPNKGVNCFADSIPASGPYAYLGGSFSGTVRASSNHAGGVNLAMADGSVHFVSSDISGDVWTAWGTMAGSDAQPAP